MTRFAPRRTTLAALLGALLIALPGSGGAQYFGRNKVQYEKFDFHIMKTSHFDLYFYPAESLVVHDAGRMAERWYARHSEASGTRSTASRSCSTPISRTSSRRTW